MRVKLLIFLLFCVCSFSEAISYSCLEIFDFQTCDKVFTGKILKIEPLSLKQAVKGEDSIHHYDIRMNKYTVSVIETFKGKKSEKKVYIYSGADGDECGYTFYEGKTYIIYSTEKHVIPERDNLPNGPSVYFTNSCTETIPFTKEAASLLRR